MLEVLGAILAVGALGGGGVFAYQQYRKLKLPKPAKKFEIEVIH